MSITNAPIITNPVLADTVIAQVQTELLNSLSWLDAAFGRAQRLTKKTPNGARIVSPAVYVGGLDGHGQNDYLYVLPDAHIGNFSFFLIEDPQEMEWDYYRQMKQTSPFSLVFWFDMRRIYSTATNRDTERVKAEILYVLNGRDGGWHVEGGHIRINRIWERPENIYQGFSLDEVDAQYLMHPYAGFRMDGTIDISTPCTLV